MVDCVDRARNGGKNGHTDFAEVQESRSSKRARFQELNDVQNKVAVVLGAQWGDEGKGKVVDMLASDADIVARCQVCTIKKKFSSLSYNFLLAYYCSDFFSSLICCS